MKYINCRHRSIGNVFLGNTGTIPIVNFLRKHFFFDFWIFVCGRGIFASLFSDHIKKAGFLL